MEFNFELEDTDLDIVFESGFVYENYSDRGDVQWKFHHGTHTRILADVLDSTPKDEGEPGCLLPCMRLCC
tara:strand:+ start:886 stop:1095 length:210 start_codon:yes stop_codon:yes gene_type:complete